jgi:hypothetical protein
LLLGLAALPALVLAWHEFMLRWGAVRAMQRIEGPGGAVEVRASPLPRYGFSYFIATCLGDLSDNVDISVVVHRADGTTCTAKFIPQADLAEDHLPMTATWTEAEVRLTEPRHRDSVTFPLHGPCAATFDWKVM